MPSIADYLKYANLQMAAEAFISKGQNNSLFTHAEKRQWRNAT